MLKHKEKINVNFPCSEYIALVCQGNIQTRLFLKQSHSQASSNNELDIPDHLGWLETNWEKKQVNFCFNKASHPTNNWEE